MWHHLPITNAAHHQVVLRLRPENFESFATSLPCRLCLSFICRVFSLEVCTALPLASFRFLPPRPSTLTSSCSASSSAAGSRCFAFPAVPAHRTRKYFFAFVECG